MFCLAPSHTPVLVIIITDNLCDETDIKAKVGCHNGRSNILLRKFYFCSERVENRLFSSYCSNL